MNNETVTPSGTAELKREIFEPILSRPVEMEEFLKQELIFSYIDLDGSHELKTCYGDILKTINALMDYTRMLRMVCDQWNLQGFHRATYEYHADKLQEIARKFQAAIGYDYDAAVEKCRKKQERKQRQDDIGEDAMTLAVRGR